MNVRRVAFPAALLGLLLAATTATEAGPLLDRLRERMAARTQTTTPGTTEETLIVGNETRTYLLHLPAGQHDGPLPVVLSFHGYNSNAAQEENVSRFSALADEKGFIAVYPEGLGQKWRFMGVSDADVQFVTALLDALEARYPVDKGRIYATGISNGAQMAWRLACDRPTLFGAFGFVSGGYPRVCAGASPPPVILFHGTKDRLLPYDGRAPQMAVRDFARGWAARAGCEPPEKGAIVYQQGDALGERWACQPGREVELYTLEGKGHSWPGSMMPARITSHDVDASAVMWAFFEAHPRS